MTDANSPEASPPVPRFSLDNWLSGRRPLVLSIVIGISILVRIAYFVELYDTPPAVQHLWEQTDMGFFDRWAGAIAAGDCLSRKVAPPLYIWQFTVAKEYFLLHPEEMARLLPKDESEVERFFAERPEAIAATQLKSETYYALHPEELAELKRRIVAAGRLWNKWSERGQFHQEPLYPYLVALTYKIAGRDPRRVFVWQLLLGVMSNVLIYFIARRHFGETAGTAAGLLAALCSPLLYFEMILLRETLIVFTGLALVWMAGTAARRCSPGWWLATGAALGLSLTLKSHFALFVLGTLALLALQHRKSLKNLLRLEASVVAGVILALAPLTVRNVVVGVSPFSLAGNGGITFVHGNSNESVSDSITPFRTKRAAEIMGQTDGRFLPTVLTTLKTYDNAADYLKLLWEKFTAAWHWFEICDNSCFYYYRLYAPVLRYLPATLLILSPLSLIGLALGLGRIWDRTAVDPAERYSQLAPHLYLLVLMNLAVLLIFFVRDRYHAPLTAALIPFAALTLAVFIRSLCDRRWVKSAVVAAGVVLLAFWTGRPLPKDVPLIRTADYAVSYRIFYEPLIKRATDAGDYAKAADVLKKALEFEPESVRRLGASHPADNFQLASLGQLFAYIHFRCSVLNRLAGNMDEAKREQDRSNELAAACQILQP